MEMDDLKGIAVSSKILALDPSQAFLNYETSLLGLTSLIDGLAPQPETVHYDAIFAHTLLRKALILHRGVHTIPKFSNLFSGYNFSTPKPAHLRGMSF